MPQEKCRDEIEMERIIEENSLAYKIIVAIQQIDRMWGFEFDTMWEQDIMKYKKINELLKNNQI